MICARSRKNSTSLEDEYKYFAQLDLYTSMAHFVGKTLKMRPNDILDTWGVPELVVAYGEYANELSKKHYEEWKALPSDARNKGKRPEEYHVKFFGTDKLEE